MTDYEVMFIVKPDLDEETTTAVVDKLQRVLTERGATIVNVDRWGRRRLAYEVAGFNDGQYVVMNFQSQPEAAKELERVMKISDEVIRYLLIRKDD